MLSMDVLRAIDAKAIEYDIPAAHLAAIVEVESAGRIFANVNGQQRPVILFEPHIFYRRLSGPARDEAVRLKLASRNWNKKLYGRTQASRWKQILDGEALLERHSLPSGAALESASYGLGQVMGYHWKSLNFSSFQQFYDTAMSGVGGQVDLMMRYCIVNSLDDELRDGRWPAFFRGYNGPKWEENGYGTAIARALPKYTDGAVVASPEPDGMLRMGSKGQRVREVQTLLVRAGYPVDVDGDFGPATRDTLRSFQAANQLKVDGVYGPKTEAALAQFRQSAEERPGQQTLTEIDEVKEGVGGAAIGVAIEVAKESVESATGQLQMASGLSVIVDYALMGLSVVAAGLAIAGVIWAVKGFLDSRKTQEV